jgi:hypothetical protein
LDGESTIAAETRSRKRTEACRSATDVTPAAEVRTAAKMSTPKMSTSMAAATEMPTAPMTAAAVTTTMATAAFRSGISSSRQRGRENDDGNPDI